jgi:uncharacterized protein (DUF58 family)
MLVLYLASIQSQTGLMFLVLGIISGCYLLNLFGAVSSIRKIRLKTFPLIKSTEGKHLNVSLELENLSSHLLGMLKVTCPYGTLFRVGTIEAHSSLHLSPELKIPSRGVYRLSELKMISSYPFGLVQSSGKIKKEGEIVVFPEIYHCRAPQASGFEPMVGGAFTGKHKNASGSDFAGVREYRSGDPVRSIHWKSSSKGNGLMVREFNEELSGRISFILDCSPGKSPDGEDLFDQAARAAGSLAFSALELDHHIEMIDLNELKLMHNPSFADGEAILEALARMEIKADCLNLHNLNIATGAISSKSSVCLILCQLNNSVHDFIRQLQTERRVISVYLPEKFHGQNDLPKGVKIKFYGSRNILE